MNIIDVKEVSFGYDNSKCVCDHLSFSVEKGKMAAIIGPNGCGKTTLLKLMSRLLIPLEGDIFLEGAPLESFDFKKLARKISFVPQEIAPLFSTTVIDFVLMGRAPYLKGLSFPTSADYQIAEENLKEVGLFKKKDRLLQTLSSGEKQRALIAKALTQSTPLLLLDEPTSHLDLRYQIETLSLLRSLQKKRDLTCVVVLHDFHLAREWSEEILLIDGSGKIAAEGSSKEVLTEKNVFDVFGIRINNKHED